jgi:hypothetical protein
MRGGWRRRAIHASSAEAVRGAASSVGALSSPTPGGRRAQVVGSFGQRGPARRRRDRAAPSRPCMPVVRFADAVVHGHRANAGCEGCTNRQTTNAPRRLVLGVRSVARLHLASARIVDRLVRASHGRKPAAGARSGATRPQRHPSSAATTDPRARVRLGSATQRAARALAPSMRSSRRRSAARRHGRPGSRRGTNQASRPAGQAGSDGISEFGRDVTPRTLDRAGERRRTPRRATG